MESNPSLILYVRTTALAASLYVLTQAYWLVNTLLHREGTPVLTVGLAALTTLAVAIHLWVLLRLVARSDEFMRQIMARRLLASAMVVIGAVTAWGLFEQAGLLPAFPLHLIYLIYFVVHLGMIPFINADRP